MTARGMPVLLDAAGADTELGYADYCGTFEVRDGQIEHHIEVSLLPRLGGVIARRSAVLNGDRLILAGGGPKLECQRVG